MEREGTENNIRLISTSLWCVIFKTVLGKENVEVRLVTFVNVMLTNHCDHTGTEVRDVLRTEYGSNTHTTCI
jgi:hypothetical protein